MVNSGTTIVELIAIYKRPRAFEAVLHDEQLRAIEKEALADGDGPTEAGEIAARPAAGSRRMSGRGSSACRAATVDRGAAN